MSYQKITIIGNLGRDPELKYLPEGKAVCDFSVAVNERRKDANEEVKEETTWFRVSFFGSLAEFASQYLSKGRQVYVEGRLRAREWTDKEGRSRTSLDVIGTTLQLIGNRPEEAAGAKAAAASAEVVDDDVPF